MKTRAYSAGLLALLLFVGIAPAYATQTPAGTTISNTATASYTDSNGNAITATSNTVSTVVQNAPTLTDTNSGNQTVAPNTNVTDTFTLTNTGNNAGDFQLSSPTLSGGSSSLTSYTVTLPSGSTYNGANAGTGYGTPTSGSTAPTTAQTFTTLSALNQFLGAVNVPSGSAATVAVLYNTGASAAGTAITDTLPATIMYPATGSAATATSATATSTATDTVQNDERLDVQKTASQNTSTGVITYTVAVNNGGSFTAHYTQAFEQSSFGFGSATTTSATAPGGILIVDKIPTFNSAPLGLTGTPTVTFTRGTNGFPNDSSEIAAVYCTTAATPASGWSTSCAGVVTYIGVLISGGTLTNSTTGGDGLQPNASGSTSTGGTPTGPKVTAAAVTLTFSVVQPTGTGSGTAGSVTNVANAISTNNNSTPQIVGPGGPYTDGNTAAAATNAATAASNTSPNSSNNVPGASGQTSNQALANYSVLVGPSGFPAALGDATNTGTATNNGDFTDWSFTDPNATPTTTSTTPGTTVTGNSTSQAETMCVPFTIQNAGNLQDSAITLAATAPTSPSGWTAQFFSNSGCTAIQGGSTAGATTSASAITLASGSSMTLYVKYSAPAGTPAFTAEQAVITATGTSNGSTANTNTTYDELYNGFIALVKQASIISTGCPTGVTVTTVCPGGVIGYSITVENLAKGATGTGVNEPASALLTNSTAGIVVVDDGTATGSWFAQIGSTGTYVTSGVNAVPTLTTAGASNTASVCTYYYGNPVGTGSTTFTAPVYTIGSLANGPSKLSCVLGGAAGSAYQLPAGSNTSSTWMVFSFNVTVRAN